MNKLELGFQGGDPLALDDLEFMQAGIAEAIKGLASVWQSGSLDSIVISGLNGNVVGLNTTVTSGFIVVNSEVYYVPGATLPNAGICIDISETIDHNGDEIFENLDPHETYKVRRGLLKTTVGGPNEIDIADFVTLKDRIIQITNCVVNKETAWVNTTFSGSWINASGGIYAGNVVRHRKNSIGNVELDGIAFCSYASLASLIFNIPAPFRPTTIKIFPVYLGDATTGLIPAFITIKPNGNVDVYSSTSPSGNWSVSLSNINFSQ